MTSPIDSNLPPSNPASGLSDVRAEGVTAPESPSFNIPNDDANYHWFLAENTGNRTTISPSNQISAQMGINNIASLVLSHIKS